MKILILKCWTYALEEEENFVVEVMLTSVSFVFCITVLFGLSLDLRSLALLALKVMVCQIFALGKMLSELTHPAEVLTNLCLETSINPSSNSPVLTRVW